MNTRYCSRAGCGHANQYTAVKPNFCGACGQPFSAAFANVPVAAPVAQPVYVPTSRPQHPAARPPRQFQSARDQRRPRSEQPVEQPDDYFDDAPADRELAWQEGQEIAAGLDPSAFGIGGLESDEVVRFGDMPNLREAATKMTIQEPKKRVPRAKKAQA